MKKTVNVWFNHWFSTAYYIIDLLKKDEAIDFYVIGTNMSLDSPIKLMCDEWYQEPEDISDKQYLDFCLEFCKNNHIEVFVPKRGMDVICKNLSRFEELSVKVLVERDYEKFAMFNDKAQTYDYCNNFAPAYVPMHNIVNTAEEFKKAYEGIVKHYERVCIKFAQDEGARSFRVIDPSISQNNGLYRTVGNKMTLEQALSVLSQQGSFPDLIVMPYLAGNEVSIDCLNTEKGLIYVPRIKNGTRITEICYNQEIVDVCHVFCKQLQLTMPFNIQFKYHEEQLFLLEINTRMSGGIQLSSLGSGVNIPNIAINQLIGNNKEWQLDTKHKKVTYIEKPLIL